MIKDAECQIDLEAGVDAKGGRLVDAEAHIIANVAACENEITLTVSAECFGEVMGLIAEMQKPGADMDALTERLKAVCEGGGASSGDA